MWVGCIGDRPIGCIAGVKYNSEYGFIGLFIVLPEYRGKGYGLQLWKHALEHLSDLPCIGLEAAQTRIKDYSKWGFSSSSVTTRWEILVDQSHSSNLFVVENSSNYLILEDQDIPSLAVQKYDANREPSPRPHFLSDWLKHPAGKVLALLDGNGSCHGFGRIRPCLLSHGEGWRIGPLLADSPALAHLLLSSLLKQHPGVVLLDSPGLNPYVGSLLSKLGFKQLSQTLRMYRGAQPPISMEDVYGLACLELG